MTSVSNSTFVSQAVPDPLQPTGCSLDGIGTLYKHCKSEHLPAEGGKIRIGTLSEFRTNENHAVRDEFEGKFRVSLKFRDNMNISKEWLDEVSFGTVPFSSGKISQTFSLRFFQGTRPLGLLHPQEKLKFKTLQKIVQRLRVTWTYSVKARMLGYCASVNHKTV